MVLKVATTYNSNYFCPFLEKIKSANDFIPGVQFSFKFQRLNHHRGNIDIIITATVLVIKKKREWRKKKIFHDHSLV